MSSSSLTISSLSVVSFINSFSFLIDTGKKEKCEFLNVLSTPIFLNSFVLHVFLVHFKKNHLVFQNLIFLVSFSFFSLSLKLRTHLTSNFLPLP